MIPPGDSAPMSIQGLVGQRIHGPLNNIQSSIIGVEADLDEMLKESIISGYWNQFTSWGNFVIWAHWPDIRKA